MIGRHPSRRKVAIAAAAAAVGLCAVAAFATPRTASPYHRLRTFARVLSHIERGYVDEVDGDTLIEGAIRGMVRSLDPHSSYMSAEDYRILKGDTEGRFGGVGLEVGVRGGALTVIAPIPETPAERAGVLPGDRIVAIEGRPTREMTIDGAVRVMRGEIGTEVTITIDRDQEPEPFELTLTRARIEVRSIEAELLAPGFPHVHVRSFQDGTAAEAAERIERLGREGGGLEGVLLDLRRNPGGLLEESVRLADLFLAGGQIVSTRGRGGAVLAEYEARPGSALEDVPLVVAIDGASASAAEIVAAALRDHGRAMLVGTRTFGKGSVQSIVPLDRGAGLKLTVARYYSPGGDVIQAAGVRPDVVVESLDAPPPDERTLRLRGAGERDLPGALDVDESEQPAEDGAPPPRLEDDYQLRIAYQLLRGAARVAAARRAGSAGD